MRKQIRRMEVAEQKTACFRHDVFNLIVLPFMVHRTEREADTVVLSDCRYTVVLCALAKRRYR